MSKMGNFSASDLKKFQKKLGELQAEQVQSFIESCAKELAARLLSKVIKRTPVGDYSKEIKVVAKRDSKHHKKGDTYTKSVPDGSGRKGGTLRRGWTSATHEEAVSGNGKGKAPAEYVNSLDIKHDGDTIIIEIINPVEYAPYVEYGHRTRGGNGWVLGRFMLTISEKEVQEITPKVLENRLKKMLGECFK